MILGSSVVAMILGSPRFHLAPLQSGYFEGLFAMNSAYDVLHLFGGPVTAQEMKAPLVAVRLQRRRHRHPSGFSRLCGRELVGVEEL
jgi:hypothetical protein